MITLDAYAASLRAVAKMKSARTIPRRVGVRSNKSLTNMIEQDHQRIKHRIGPMLGYMAFDTAGINICGVELAAKIREHQPHIGKLPG